MSSHPLPSNEAELLSVLGGMPYLKRNGYALRLAKQHADNPGLVTLIRELLTTSPLPSQVPFPNPEPLDPTAMVTDESESTTTIELQFPQTNASKRFVQREIGLTMAATIGKSALPILLDALVHPSNAGRKSVIAPCVTYASDDELVEVYNRCVPAVQAAIREKLGRRDEVRRRLGIPVKEKVKQQTDPAIVTLERELKECEENDREKLWSRSPALSVWPHRHLHDPKLVPQDSMHNLVEHLFDLAERYPVPVSNDRDWRSYILPSAFTQRLFSFYICDLERTVKLILKFAHAPDPNHKGRDALHLPTTFNQGKNKHGKNNQQFWSRVPLDKQMAVAEPFVASLIKANNGALLKNGKLHGARILGHFRWPVVRSLMSKALPYLTSNNITKAERKNVLEFILSGLSIFETRLSRLARVDADVKRQHQRGMEGDAFSLLAQSTDFVLDALRRTEKNDEEMIKQLKSQFIEPLVPQRPEPPYPALTRVLYDKVSGIFSMTQVSQSELFSIARLFFNPLRTRVPTISQIPDDGIVQPYSNMPKTENDDIFEVLLNLQSPRECLHANTYGGELSLSRSQRNRIWDLINDPKLILQYLTKENVFPDVIFLNIQDFSPSPAARRPIVAALLVESESFPFAHSIYALCDITDTETRSALQKLTYVRVFDDRYKFYSALIVATRESGNVKEWIKTLKWFIPRTKNEIPLEAERLPGLFSFETLGYDVLMKVFKSANEEEAKELVDLYLGWEKMNNEAVTSCWNLRKHLTDIANCCLQYFCNNVSSPFFQFGLDQSWMRILHDKGLTNARKTYSINVKNLNSPCKGEAEELARRQFMQSMDRKLGQTGYWRIREEEKFVEKIYEQYEKVFGDLSFKDSSQYLGFIRTMTTNLGMRWNKVPRIVEELDHQMDILRRWKGTPDKPAVWRYAYDPGSGDEAVVARAVEFVQGVRGLYLTPGPFDEDPPAWWKEFRELKLLSSMAMDEARARYKECYDEKRRQVDHNKVNELVEKLIGMHDSAVYIDFVQSHILQRRQDLLQDQHILQAPKGVFYQPAEDEEPLPARWYLTASRKLSPHQCEVFARRFDEVIHSDDTPFVDRVIAAEQLTKLPTTTIHELAALLTENVNPRISEAILMFLPRLDEPAAGIQFLLSPTILDGDLARTAIFGVKRSLEYVTPQDAVAMVAGTFPSERSKKHLKVTVAKELARTVCEYAALPEAQVVIRKLWDRKLHQDVRVALLQSIIPLLGSPQEDLSWYVITDAIKNPKMQLDDTLYPLVSVEPQKHETREDYVALKRPASSQVLINLAIVDIPTRCCDRYVEEILWPLARLKQYKETQSMSKHDVEELKERVKYIRRGAYFAIFERFLTTSNATKFAGRAVDDITHAHSKAASTSDSHEVSAVCPFCAAYGLPEDPVDCHAIFIYLANCIERCIAKDPAAWSSLVKIVDLLALFVKNMQNRPTRPGLLACKWLNTMQLDSRCFFQEPSTVRKRVTQDRTSLLDPLKKHGVLDQFSVLALNRRIQWFEHSDKEGKEKSKAGALLSEVIELSQSFILEREETLRQFRRVLGACPTTMRLALCFEVLKDQYGVSDCSWSLLIKLETLERAWHGSDEYARLVSSFTTHVATNESSFYRTHWKTISGFIQRLFSDKDYTTRHQTAYPILIHPLLERDGPDTVDRLTLDHLFQNQELASHFCSNSTEWVLRRMHDILLTTKRDDKSSIRNTLRFCLKLMTYVRKADKKQLTLAQCMVAESVYFGTVLNLNLKDWAKKDPSEAVISFPYFFSTDDSGGDIEDRKTKSTVEALEASYGTRKAKLGAQFFKSQTMETNASSTTLTVLKRLYDHYPKLIVAHPSLFFSCLCLSFSSPDTSETSTNLIELLKRVLKPDKEGENGAKWGWVPPPALALSFARKMLTEVPEEISDISLDENWTVGPIQCKLCAVDLLLWWKTTYKDGSKNMEALLQAEGLEELTREYEELQMMAWKDRDRAVHLAILRQLTNDAMSTVAS
ncbi:hypothetical protein K435DRAFT_960144 [Dendrothele bispora CBS 962.96]|uniref:Uncharacterized protein n=1 Tax=Dendrothele bispora (strain CBS 962.96) TaxID=1314807 RepID=A0A4S8MWN9_DENBC|nr:hypothetical protein K435DRAFT_960144 [Dendrothele bispora CBS 962.96]